MQTYTLILKHSSWRKTINVEKKGILGLKNFYRLGKKILKKQKNRIISVDEHYSNEKVRATTREKSNLHF